MGVYKLQRAIVFVTFLGNHLRGGIIMVYCFSVQDAATWPHASGPIVMQWEDGVVEGSCSCHSQPKVKGMVG